MFVPGRGTASRSIAPPCPGDLAARRRGIRLEELGTDRIRAVTHAGVDDDAVDRAISVFGDLLGHDAMVR